MGGIVGVGCFEGGLVDFVFEYLVVGEFVGLDVFQNVFYFGFGFGCDNVWVGDVFIEFGGV